MIKIPPSIDMPPLVVRTRPAFEITDDAFYELCRMNPDLRIERTAEGEVVMMPPAGGEAGRQNARITYALQAWADLDDSGVVFDSSGGFHLLDGAIRAPDAAWVRRARLAPLRADQKQKFLPLCPDFVVELRSPSDALVDLQAKMAEYMDNGALLGWLIDPIERQVFIYRPGRAPERLAKPHSVAADPELPGFVLDLSPIWTPGF